MRATDKLVKFYAADPVAQKKAVQVLSSVLCAARHRTRTGITAHARTVAHAHAHGDREIFNFKCAQQEATDQEKKIDVLKEEKEKIVRQLEAVGGSGDVAPSEDASPEPANGAFSFSFSFSSVHTPTARATRHATRADFLLKSLLYAKQEMPRGVNSRRWSTSR